MHFIELFSRVRFRLVSLALFSSGLVIEDSAAGRVSKRTALRGAGNFSKQKLLNFSLSSLLMYNVYDLLTDGDVANPPDKKQQLQLPQA